MRYPDFVASPCFHASIKVSRSSLGSILYFLAKHRIESRTRSSLNPLLPNKPPIAFIAEKQQESRFYTTIEMNLNKARGKSTRKKEDIASQITIDGTYYSLETDSRMEKRDIMSFLLSSNIEGERCYILELEKYAHKISLTF